MERSFVQEPGKLAGGLNRHPLEGCGSPHLPTGEGATRLPQNIPSEFRISSAAGRDRCFEEVDSHDLAAPPDEIRGVLDGATAGVEDGAGGPAGLFELTNNVSFFGNPLVENIPPQCRNPDAAASRLSPIGTEDARHYIISLRSMPHAKEVAFLDKEGGSAVAPAPEGQRP